MARRPGNPLLAHLILLQRTLRVKQTLEDALLPIRETRPELPPLHLLRRAFHLTRKIPKPSENLPVAFQGLRKLLHELAERPLLGCHLAKHLEV